MTTEEKLEHAVKFIKSVEQLDVPWWKSLDADCIDGWCEECGSDDVEIIVPCDGKHFVKAEVIDALKDQAWHVLADITD